MLEKLANMNIQRVGKLFQSTQFARCYPLIAGTGYCVRGNFRPILQLFVSHFKIYDDSLLINLVLADKKNSIRRID